MRAEGLADGVGEEVVMAVARAALAVAGGKPLRSWIGYVHFRRLNDLTDRTADMGIFKPAPGVAAAQENKRWARYRGGRCSAFASDCGAATEIPEDWADWVNAMDRAVCMAALTGRSRRVRPKCGRGKLTSMSGQALRLLDEALQLSEEDRAELALRLLDSVGEPAAEVERAWIEEAKRRLAEIQRGEVGTVPWAEARERIFAR